MSDRQWALQQIETLLKVAEEIARKHDVPFSVTARFGDGDETIEVDESWQSSWSPGC